MLTSKDSLPHPLISDLSVSFAALSERRVIHKSPHVIVPLEIRPTFQQLLIIKVRRDIGYLYVGYVRIEILCYNLQCREKQRVLLTNQT